MTLQIAAAILHLEAMTSLNLFALDALAGTRVAVGDRAVMPGWGAFVCPCQRSGVSTSLAGCLWGAASSLTAP